MKSVISAARAWLRRTVRLSPPAAQGAAGRADRARPRRRRISSARLAALALAVSPAAIGRAGTGPENVLVVVNALSWASQTVANHFIALRKIPTSNVFYLSWDGPSVTTDVETFREKILGPTLLNIERRGLSHHIDVIVYSSDFPTEIDLAPDLRGAKLLPQFAPSASITAATYNWTTVMQHSYAMIGLQTNQYMRNAAGRITTFPSHGFHSWYGWGPSGELLEAGGQHYMLSTMLGVTSGRGNSVSEAVTYLRRSAAADGTAPAGTIYYLRNDNPRSTARGGGFDTAARDLRALGVKAEVLPGVLPEHRDDVQGAMLGVDNFSWPASGSRILPGAICEHLTSFGGAMAEDAAQTPVSELLRFGAAGTSGTVVEPYAFQDKFPTPDIHVHYARGCTLAESFYQSVFGPYQLLIVGDPLCRPWAKIPEVQAEGISIDHPTLVKGTVEFVPQARAASKPAAPYQFELFVDGRRMARAPQGEPLRLDTTALADGFHEGRIVATTADEIETQGRLIFPLTVDNRGRRMNISVGKAVTVEWDKMLVVHAQATGMDGGVLFHNGRVLGSFSGETADVEINPRTLGMGPVTIEARGLSRSGPEQQVAATPLRLVVNPPTPLAPLAAGARDLVRGLMLKIAGGKRLPVQETRDPNWLAAAGVKPGERYELEALFHVPLTDVYQFRIQQSGDLSLHVDKSAVYDTKSSPQATEAFVPVTLGEGLHELRIAGRAGETVSLKIAFGGPGLTSLDGARFRHQD